MKRREKVERNLSILEAEWLTLMDILIKYSDEALNKKPSEESWSAIQTMHHLILSEKASLDYCKKKLSFNPTLKNAGLLAFMRSKFVNVYLSSPLKFSAPKFVATPMLPKSDTFENTKEQWYQNRTDLKSFFNEIESKYLDKEVYKHPFLGRMSLNGMLDFFISHFRRHRRQIIRALDN